MKQEIKEISVDLLDDPQVAVRSEVNDDGIEELTSSIKNHGLLQPITVRPVGKRFEVIAGHRRLTACRRLGLAKISCVIRVANDREATVLKIHENMLRRDINPIDEAVFLAKTLKEQGIGVKEAAEMLNRSKQYIQDRIDILLYPDYLIEAIGEKQIGLGAANWLNRITDERTRANYVSFAARGGINVKRAIAWFESWKAGQIVSNPQEIVVKEEGVEGPEVRFKEDCLICRTADFPQNMTLYYIHHDCAEKLSA